MTHVTPEIRTPDIVGFGALNVDYIASASQLSQRTSERITESASRFEWNHEGPVDEPTILDAMERLGGAALASSLGGSAWITIFSLAQMRVGLQLGYVGVVGYMVKPGLSFINQMDQLAIDRTWVASRVDQPCGICLSYINDNDRALLIHPGANLRMNQYLQVHAGAIAAYLASARYVHVTSFLDDLTPIAVRHVLAEAKILNPNLQISFDPGYDWAYHPTEAIKEILALSDLLFVNYREFKELGTYEHGESDTGVADRILARCGRGCRIFVTKRYDFVEVFRSSPEGVIANKFQLQRGPHEDEIEDATGAGDVFAAAVLASLTSGSLQLELGASLGLSLARYKLSRDVATDISPDLSKGFLQQMETVETSPRKPAAVLIMYENETYCHELERFLHNSCHLSTYRWPSQQLAVSDLIHQLDRQLSNCSFAACLLNHYESGTDNRRPANMETVHQAGILQGRYGFNRVALLLEKGCDMFSNIAGLIRLDFPVGQVGITFLELERMLQREGLLEHRGNHHA